MQRISAGTLRGRKLMALPTGVPGLRPTASKVRAAIFDRLGPGLTELRVLDLFAGSGALAIEALSRGASRATLVEQDARVVKHLQAQLAVLGLADRSRVCRADALAMLVAGRAKAGHDAAYDLVFVDPPFASPHVFGPIVTALVEHGWLGAGARIVCERERVRGAAPNIEFPPQVELATSRVYGQVTVEILQLRAAPGVGGLLPSRLE